MPTTADVGLLRLLLTHLGNLGILLVGGEELVDVDFAPAARKGDMLFGRQILIAEEDDPVIDIGLTHGLHLAVTKIVEINAKHFDATIGGQFAHLNGCASHGISSSKDFTSLRIWGGKS